MMTLRQSVPWAVGKTQASSVSPVVRFSEALWGMVTKLSPLKSSAPPNRPSLVRRTPAPSVPVLLFPEPSATVEPPVSLKLYAATRPAGRGAPGIDVAGGAGTGTALQD